MDYSWGFDWSGAHADNAEWDGTEAHIVAHVFPLTERLLKIIKTKKKMYGITS